MVGEEAKLQQSEAAKFMATAEAEVTFPAKKISIPGIMSKTGLTREQVRRIREKPEYQEYLALARERQKAKTLKGFLAPTIKNAPKAPPPATTTSTQASTSILSSDESIPDIVCNISDSGSSDESNKELLTVTPSAGPSQISNEEVPDTRTTNKRRRTPDSSPEVLENPATRPRLDTTPKPQHNGNFNRVRIISNVTVQRAAASTPRVPAALQQQLLEAHVIQGPEEIKTWLQDFLLEQAALGPDNQLQDLVLLVKAALAEPIQVLKPIIEEWIGKNLNSVRYKKGVKSRSTNSNVQPSQAQGGSRNYAQTFTGRGLRAQNFKKAQDLFGSNRSSLASIILAGKSLDAPEELPELHHVEEFYGSILESPSSDDNEVIKDRKVANGGTEDPITESEIDDIKTGWTNSAPGPDGITVQSVRMFDSKKLAVVLNAIFYRNCLPDSWKRSRTILIHKDGDRTNPSNYRPITISSAVLRLFHRLLAKRIKKAINPSIHQRGFVEIDGTMANAMITQYYIRSRTESRKPFNVLSLDLQKAFDTVNQGAVYRAMERMGLSQHLVQYVRSTMEDSVTSIKLGNASSRDIRVKRGVKQGDPLSPLLFNMVVDEALCLLDSLGRGGSLDNEGSVKCPAVAFADDLVIFEDQDKYIPLDLSLMDGFFGRRGMQLNVGKCSLLSAALVPGGGKVVPRTKNAIKFKNVPLRLVSDFEPAKYLGHALGSSGILKPSICNLKKWLENVMRSPLKPDQKLVMIKTYVIPKILYGLQVPGVTGRILREADRLIRHYTKKVLHLNIHTSDAAFYAKIRDGGLGIMNLKGSIPKIFLGRLTSILSANNDTSIQYVFQTPFILDLMRRLEAMMGNQPPDIHWAGVLKDSPLLKGLEAASEDQASRSWIDAKPPGWTGRDFVRAVQLRTANLPTAGMPSNPVDQRGCRAGCAKNETIAHVLQGCPATHWERIRRHNEIAKKLATQCKKRGWTVAEEPHVRHNDGTLFKPDIIATKGDSALVLDVQVIWEGHLSLAAQHETKRAKYEDDARFRAAFERLYPGKVTTHAPLTIGARGIWPRCNSIVEELLQLDKHFKSSCVQSALKWGSSIHAAFSKKIWRGRQGPGRGRARP